MLEQILEKYLPEDVIIEWTSIGTSSAHIRDAIIANKLDIGGLSYTSFITSYENGMPLALISGTSPQPSAMFSTRSDINTFEDIKPHHKIGMSGKGTNIELAFSLRSKEVFGDAMMFADSIVNISDPDMVSLIKSSDNYELYIVGYPSMQLISNYKNAKLIEDLTETIIADNGIGLLFVTTEYFYRKNPKLIEAFRKACEEAIIYIDENTEEAAIKLSNFYGSDNPEEVLFLLNKCRVDLRIPHYDKFADILLEMGILSKPAKKISQLPFYDDIKK